MKRLLLLICYLPSIVFAFDNFTLKLDSIAGNGWSTKKITAHTHLLSNKKIALTLHIATLNLHDIKKGHKKNIKKTIKNIKLTCQNTIYNDKQIACPHAKLHIDTDLLDKPTIELSFAYHFNSQKIQLNINKIALAGGDINLQAKSAPSGWQAILNINEIQLDKLLTHLNTLTKLPSDLSLKGRTTLKIKLTGDDTKLRSASINGQTLDFNFSNAGETQVGENIALKIALQAKSPRIADTKFQIQGTLTVNAGEMYIDPIYVEIKKSLYPRYPLTMAVDLTWQPQHLKIHKLSLTQPNIINLQGVGDFNLGEKWAINTLSVQLKPSPLKQLYTHYLQPSLGEDSQFSQLHINGQIEAALNWNKNNKHGIVRLHQLNIEDQKKRFGIKGLRGKIQWHNHAIGYPTHLHWSSGYLASSIQLGASQLRASLRSNRIKLLAPWYQPIFDGAIRIQQFRLINIDKENMTGQLRGRLYPISLSTLTSALELPTLNGQISGKIPWVNYRNNHLKIAGLLRMRVFDGDVVIRSLTIDNLLGNIPRLKAKNIEVNKINLQTLTNVTEFGEIQGQLSGYVRKLELLNWQPISFNAHFMTPKDDTMPHRISQKAIRNISNLSGNPAVNAISYSVLSIFENFSYRRIGWGCRLRKGICKMSGAGAANNGYYIVKGGGLPRIDVIGYNQTVDWNVLVTRLKRITNLTNLPNIGDPIIK